jgi:glycosyltransferase involved in cell wall biosynthesis
MGTGSGRTGTSRDSRLRRVAVVTHGFPPIVGGADIHHYLGAQIVSAVATVEVFTADLILREADGTKGGRVDPPSRAASSVPVHFLPSFRIAGERFIVPSSFWRALSRFQPDVIWTNSPSVVADIAFVYARVHQIRCVATYHADLVRTTWYRELLYRLESHLLRWVDGIEVSSEYYARKLRARGISPDRLKIILPYSRLTIPPSPDTDVQAANRPTHPGPDSPFLFVGVLDHAHAYKRPELLIEQLGEARRSGADVHAVIVGEGRRRPELEDLVRSLGLSSAVRFAGRPSDSELIEHYRRSWALVLPADSDREGFGLVALEALRWSCPVIASSATPIAELVRSEGCGFVWDVGIPDGLSATLITCWNDPGAVRSASESALRFSSKISWDRTKASTIEFVLGNGYGAAQSRESELGPGLSSR